MKFKRINNLFGLSLLVLTVFSLSILVGYREDNLFFCKEEQAELTLYGQPGHIIVKLVEIYKKVPISYLEPVQKAKKQLIRAF